MEITAYNPQKGRLETLDMELTAENTTWFTPRGNPRTALLDSITDVNGGLLIKALDYSYPIWLDDVSRANINYCQKEANELIRQYQ